MKTLQEIKTKTDDSLLRKNFVWSFSLCILLEQCLIKDDYKAPESLGQNIVLTDEGNTIAQFLRQQYPDISEAEIKLALFVKLYYNDLLIDLERTNLAEVETAISQDIAEEKIKYPWAYDRLLYDRFFENFPKSSQRNALSYSETLMLLENSPQGVFQVQDLLVGSFGILHSSCKRDLLPTTSVPLWHCPDPSCESLHTSRLTTGNSLVSNLLTTMAEFCIKTYGERQSEWQDFYDEISITFNYYDEQNLSSFPWLVGNAFSENEIRNILAYLLNIHSSEIRQRLPQTKRIKNILANAPDKIVQKLSKPECFQVLLLMGDEHIISAIEALIEDKTIKIPATEIRSPRYFRGSSWERIMWQCSPFGIRSKPSSNNIGITRLKKLIYEVYKSEEKREQLKWVLRHSAGDDYHEKLDDYLFSNNPRQIVRELILSNPNHLELAFDNLRFGKFSFPKSSEDEDRLISKILWKLDFNIISYPDFQEKFWKRHSNLLDVSRTFTDYNENDKENIRSASVNLFVSLEEILDYSLSFTTWVLLSDHYGNTRFICDLDEARKFMAKTLSEASIQFFNESEPINYNPNGVNTLFPLISGFRLLSLLCKKILEENLPNNKRPTHQFPRFFEKTSLQTFPFLNKTLLFDLKETCATKILETLNKITLELETGNVSNVRNRLQHNRKREEFPQQDEIDKACGAISSAISKMEKSGICPLVYFQQNSNTDSFDRISITLQDYKGGTIILHRPFEFSSSIKISTKNALLVTPWLHLKNSSHPLFFAFVESSDYREMLKDFPKRRFVEE